MDQLGGGDRAPGGRSRPNGSDESRVCACGTRLSTMNPGVRCSLCERKFLEEVGAPPPLPTGFWDTDEYRAAFATRDMGKVFQVYRADPRHRALYGPDGITQGTLGTWLGKTQAQISRIERGESNNPTFKMLVHWAQLLGMPQELLWFDLPDQRRPATQPTRPVRPRAETRPTLLKELLRTRHLLPHRRFCKEYEKVAAQLDKSLVRTAPSERQYKRWLNGSLTSLPYSEPCAVLEAMFPGYTARQLFEPATQVEAHQDSSAAGPNVDSNLVQAGREALPPGANHGMAPFYLVSGTSGAASDPPSMAVIRTMSDSFQMADRKLGGGKLYLTVSQYLRSEIAPCLLDPPDDCSPDELFSAAASLTEIAGWMAHDGGNNGRARGHFSQAYRLAAAGENAALSANVCASMAHLAIQLDLPDDAERISAAGLNHLAEIDGAKHLIARLRAMQARAYAMRGLEYECQAALEAAHGSLASGKNDTTSIGWIASFDEASLASESALCFLSLGSLNQAEKESRKVIHLRAGDRVRSRALGQLTLANVLLREDAYDEAARVGLEICAVAPVLNSARVHSGLSRLGQALAPYGATPEVAAFLAAQAEVCQKPTVQHQETRWPV